MSIYDIAIRVIDNKISKLEDFSLKELKKEIKDKGGVCKVSSDLTIKEYLKLLDEEIIKYDSTNNIYHVLDFPLGE